jgi:P-type Cu2+ transporter
MTMTERKQQVDEHIAHHPDHASMHHHTTDPNAAQELAQHASMQSAHTTEAHHASHDSGHTGHHAHAAQMGDHAGHGGHASHSEAMFQRPFWISLLLTIPVLVYAELLQELLGYTAPPFPGSPYVGAVLGSIIYWYGGWVFLRGAMDELRARTPGMMTLVALAITDGGIKV